MNRYRILQLDKHTWQLEDMFHTYFYLIEGEEQAVLFDTGNGFPELPKIIKELTDKPVEVILSHGHFDHTGCAFEFAKCRIHPADLEVLNSGFAKADRNEKYKFFENLYQVTLTQQEKQYFLQTKIPHITSFIDDGDVIELGNRTLEIVTTPGHTKGSVCMIDRTNRYLFSGDTVCDDEILVYFDHSATVSDVKMSNEKLLSRSSQFDHIWPGHHRCPLDVSII